MNEDTAFEILETDIVREADSPEVRGVDMDEAFGGLEPVKGDVIVLRHSLELSGKAK